MKHGLCPKCNQRNVHMLDTARYSEYQLPITTWRNAGLTYYVCADRGYVEIYVLNEKERADPAKERPRVE